MNISTEPNVAEAHRYYTSNDLLDLVLAMRDFDPGVASHTLTGLLRMAAAGTATASEKTALRITGLGDLDGKHFFLTQTAEALLNDFSSGQVAGQSRSRRDDFEDNTPELPDSIDNPDPIAKLKIAGILYEIAEEPTVNVLVFRQAGKREWKMLGGTLENGWSAIAAEIIHMTRDTTREYIRMHMIHRRDTDVGDNVRLFDLYGYEWFILIDESGAMVRLDGKEWKSFDLEGMDPENDMGQIAVNALLTALPNAWDYFKDDIDAWSKRIAAGASVVPVL